MVKYNYETNKHSLGQEILGMDKKQAILKADLKFFAKRAITCPLPSWPVR